MTAYRCLAASPGGRTELRTIDADSEASAAARLLAEGLTPLDIRSGKRTLLDRLNEPVQFSRRLSIAEQALIFTQLAMLLRAGLPVDRSIDLLRDQAPKTRQRDMLARVLASVRSGTGLAGALEERHAFPPFAIGVIRAAEQSGRLADALASLGAQMSDAAATRRQLVTALTYPAAVLVSTVLALALVLTMVVPQFEPVFAGEESRLPTLTRAVLALSSLVNDHLTTLLLLLIALLTACVLAPKTAPGAGFIQRYRQRIPGIRLRDQHLAAQFMGLLGMMIGNGVTVVAALRFAGNALPSVRWRLHAIEVERRVREGEAFSRSLSSGAFVPITAIRLIEVGERSGALADTCLKASAIMGEAVRARIQRIVALANPIAVILLGGVVAMLVAGVMLGIFALGDFTG